MREIEQDGFITDEIYIKETPSRRGIELEQSGDGKAVPATECRYPNCEECDDYIRFRGANYCTVPMVLNKQTWRLTADLIADMRKEIDEVKEMVYDEILGKKSSAETGNYLFSQANSGSVCVECIHYDPTSESTGHCRKHNRAVTVTSSCNEGEFRI